MGRSTWAVASLVLGIFSFVTVFGAEKPVLAIIFGALALKEMKKKKVSGKWMAITGIVLGAIVLALLIWSLPLLLQYMSRLI